MPLGQIIRQRREQLHLTLDQVAAKCSCSKPYLSTIETGKVKNPPSDDLLTRLERALEFGPGELLYIAHMQKVPSDVRSRYERTEAENQRWRHIVRHVMEKAADGADIREALARTNLDAAAEAPPLAAGRLVPVINKVAAGYPTDFDDLEYPVGVADDYVRAPDIHDPNAFAVRVVGDSMMPKFSEGDIIIFSPAAEVRSGDDCFVRFADPHETTFKRVFFETDNRLRLQPLNDRYAPTLIDGRRITGIYRAVAKYQNL
ncbi:MAG TPA: XRE family transcriptional regulator [Phycisphaerales bacterium]|nr:XRE family transcriptional regulator [Phycisphaerales bacterium]